MSEVYGGQRLCECCGTVIFADQRRCAYCLMPTPPASQESAVEVKGWVYQKFDGGQVKDFVLASDYATLTAELAEAQEQRDSLRDECERLRTWAESLENDWMIREQCALINGGMKVEQACIHAETRLKMAKVAALSASGRDADGDGRGK